jgi:hypothetical protein
MRELHSGEPPAGQGLCSLRIKEDLIAEWPTGKRVPVSMVGPARKGPLLEASYQVQCIPPAWVQSVLRRGDVGVVSCQVWPWPAAPPDSFIDRRVHRVTGKEWPVVLPAVLLEGDESHRMSGRSANKRWWSGFRVCPRPTAFGIPVSSTSGTHRYAAVQHWNPSAEECTRMRTTRYRISRVLHFMVSSL